MTIAIIDVVVGFFFVWKQSIEQFVDSHLKLV